MIKANELRIGNWVSEFGEYKQISLQGDDLWHTENFTPIPLTPEILEAAGAKRTNHYADIKIGNLYFNDFIAGGKGIKLNNHRTYIQYLHQFQNLFFSLTGTELEINMMQKA